MNTDRSTDLVEQTIHAAWPGDLGDRVLEAVSEDDAFGALAGRIARALRAEDDPAALLAEIDEGTVEWALTDADHPAAFLASRLP